MALPVRKSAPPREIRVPVLRVDPEKYPNLAINPALERALRIRQELEKGRDRAEAVALADQAMGRPGPPKGLRPQAKGKQSRRPASQRKEPAKTRRATPRARHR